MLRASGAIGLFVCPIPQPPLELSIMVSATSDNIALNNIALNNLALNTTLPQANSASLFSDPLGTQPPRALAFIDTRLADYQILAQSVQPGTAVYTLNTEQNALSQITQVLAGYQDLTQVAIFSHGSAGAMQLGDLTLAASDLGFYSEDLRNWAKAFAADASLALYGCDVAAGEVGAAFVNQLHDWIGVNVAASTDLTGSAALNGNWTLEYSTNGTVVNAVTQWAAGYDHVLATFAVTNTLDSGAGSLRDAVAAANALTTEANEIVFQLAGDTPQTITLTSGQLTITGGELTIQGPSADWLTISGNHSSRVFQINPAATVTLAQLTVANGQITTTASDNVGGGGILNNGTLNLHNSTVTNNIARAADGYNLSRGGGIANMGTLQVLNSQITNNQVIASSSAFGGGIYNGIAGLLTVDNSLVADNQAIGQPVVPQTSGFNYSYYRFDGGKGGGIYQVPGPSVSAAPLISITNSRFTGNSAFFGGGFYGENANITNCSFTDNTVIWNGAVTPGVGIPSGAAIYVSPNLVSAVVTVTNSEFSGNDIMVPARVGTVSSPSRVLFRGTLVVSNSQFSDGGIVNTGSTTINNSRFVGNDVGLLNTIDNGTGMVTFVSGTATVTNSQFIANTVGIRAGARLTVNSSQFANNQEASILREEIIAFITAFITVERSQFIGKGIIDAPRRVYPFPPLTLTDNQFIDG
jgi:Domain of unknown function (DUF4347)